MYCLYVGVDYTYIDVNALAQGIKSFLASQVWFQAVAGGLNLWHRLARNYYSATLTIRPPRHHCMYVCTHACMYVFVCMYVCM